MRYNPENVEDLLFDLQKANPTIKGIILFSVEGLPIASTISKELNKSQLSALSATLLAVGKRGNTEMKNGEFNHLYIKGSNGGVLIFQFSKFEVFALFTDKNTNLKSLLQSLNDFKY